MYSCAPIEIVDHRHGLGQAAQGYTFLEPVAELAREGSAAAQNRQRVVHVASQRQALAVATQQLRDQIACGRDALTDGQTACIVTPRLLGLILVAIHVAEEFERQTLLARDP